MATGPIRKIAETVILGHRLVEGEPWTIVAVRLNKTVGLRKLRRLAEKKRVQHPSGRSVPLQVRLHDPARHVYLIGVPFLIDSNIVRTRVMHIIQRDLQYEVIFIDEGDL